MAKKEAATIQFIKWSDLYEKDKPYQVFLEEDIGHTGAQSTNLAWEEKEVIVEDFRGNPDYDNIDNHGFTSRKLSGFSTIPDPSLIEKAYISAVSQLLYNEIEGAGTVFIFDWRVS